MNKVTQVQKIVDFCKAHTWITQRDAYKLGIYRLASRIYDMVQMGFVFIDEYIKVENADGTTSYVKRYSIVKFPSKEVYNVG